MVCECRIVLHIWCRYSTETMHIPVWLLTWLRLDVSLCIMRTFHFSQVAS